ncbi:hypothetical protein HYU45_04435 [Candidatus Daviesbacteria bacterium]|nr:hypothetical protein [Candidatus Daviesbacteria bacterium]
MKADILLKYENKWVALSKSRDKVLYAAPSIDSLLKKISGRKKKEVILHFVPPFDGTLSLWLR